MSDSIRGTETAVHEPGTLPVPAVPMPGLLPEDLATITDLIGGAKPAVPALLVELGKSVRDVRLHDHSTQREDWYCMNLTSFMGERMGPVLRRLLDAEARISELEAQREQRRARLVALQNDALSMRGSLSPMGEARKVPFPLGETLTPAVDWLIARVAELEAAPLTVYRAAYDAEEMGLFATRAEARAQCEAHERNDWLNGAAPHFKWVPDDPEDDLSPEELWSSVTADAEGSETGYVVTPLRVPAEYDEEADQ